MSTSESSTGSTERRAFRTSLPAPRQALLPDSVSYTTSHDKRSNETRVIISSRRGALVCCKVNDGIINHGTGGVVQLQAGRLCRGARQERAAGATRRETEAPQCQRCASHRRSGHGAKVGEYAGVTRTSSRIFYGLSRLSHMFRTPFSLPLNVNGLALH